LLDCKQALFTDGMIIATDEEWFSVLLVVVSKADVAVTM